VCGQGRSLLRNKTEEGRKKKRWWMVVVKGGKGEVVEVEVEEQEQQQKASSCGSNAVHAHSDAHRLTTRTHADLDGLSTGRTLAKIL